MVRGLNKHKHYAKQNRSRKKVVILSLVALVVVLAIFLVSTNAWIESISYIKIYTQGNAKGTVETAKLQHVNLENGNGYDIDLTDYFRPSGGYHLAPASSADGDTMYFKGGMNGTTQLYRLGSVNDKNVNYVSFTVKTLTNVSLAFSQVPKIKFDETELSNNDKKLVRFSVGDTYGNFTVFSLYDTEFTENVIAGENGTTMGSVTVHPFKDYITGKQRVVETTANGYLSFNMWIQDPTGDSSSVYHDKTLTVENLKLVTVKPFYVKAVSNNTVSDVGGKVAIENEEGTYAASATYYVTIGQKINLYAAASLTNGYQFLGWATSPTESIISNSAVNPFEYTVQNNIDTLYAKFSNRHELYMKPAYQHKDSNGDDANVRYAAYLFGFGVNEWKDMTLVSGGTWDGYYKCEYSGTANSVIFCYMDKNSTTNNWDNRWLQTFDLVVPSKNGEYGYVVTSRLVKNLNRGDSITYNPTGDNIGTNKLLGYWLHSHIKVGVAYKSDSDSGTKGDISAGLKDSTTSYSSVTYYETNQSDDDSSKNVLLDGKSYPVNSSSPEYDKKVVLKAEDSSTMDFKGWYKSDGTLVSTASEYEVTVTAPDNGFSVNPTTGEITYTEETTVLYYAKYKTGKTYYVENTQNWSGDLYAYAWNSSGNSDWIQMTDTEKENSGHKVFKVTVSSQYTSILFNANNGSNQTEDIVISSKYGNNNCVWISSDKDGSNHNKIGGSFTFTE